MSCIVRCPRAPAGIIQPVHSSPNYIPRPGQQIHPERAFPKWSSLSGETFSFTKVKQLLFTKQVCPWRECVLLL